ncbi:MAG: Snf7 family protein [Candidatus Methylarchaceae archaeon HK01B]|nr:Snf7 family protein [Candidatus Methylarchaceae archaeon HK01M]MCP8312286.1 Snf7 family protein [Candidatus Methylarchaceae archaeon HK02M1]MCP8318307.1 Snf7 family protein [Candidatus Methylarchaceae archaeon HK01B]
MPQFADRWAKSSSPTIGEKIKETIRPAGPLKPRLDAAIRQIQAQVSKLDSTTTRLKDRDNAIFNKVVQAIQRHDMQHASVFANELAEIRKMNKMVTQAKIALEQIVLRLNTVQELGDVVVTLTPAMAVIRNVKSGLGSVLPEADREIGEISGLLSSILVDAGQLGGYTLNFEAANEDAERIISEASIVAEERMKEKFPELPMGDKLPSTEGLE